MANNFAFLFGGRYDSDMKEDKNSPNKLNSEQAESLLSILQFRFKDNMDRYPDLKWAEVRAKLEAHPEKLGSLSEMERTGGELDVVGYDEAADAMRRDKEPLHRIFTRLKEITGLTLPEVQIFLDTL